MSIVNEWSATDNLANCRKNCCTAQEGRNRASLMERKPVEKLQLRAHLEQCCQRRKKNGHTAYDGLTIKEHAPCSSFGGQGHGVRSLPFETAFLLLCFLTPSILQVAVDHVSLI
jgi:hypothetical protein